MDNGFSGQKVYEKKQDMVWRQVGEETILVPVRREMADLDSVFTLNETAAFVWSLIDGKLPLADIRDRMVAEFEVEREQAGEDLERCIAKLQEIMAVRELPDSR